MGSNDSRTISFDVFETVLVRPTATARGMFLRVAADLQAAGLIPAEARAASDFATRREEVDKQIWCKTAGHCELRMLYQALALDHGWKADQVEAAARTELAVELRDCVGVPSALARLQEMRRQGCRIVFISDTYLRGKELQELLIAKEAYMLGDRLYASSDHGVTKSSGDLFALVRRDIPGGWSEHLGNDQHSDVNMARRAGVTGVQLAAGNLNARERIALEEFRRQGLEELGDKLVGAARIARLKAEVDSDRQVAARKTVLADVACPFFAAYALWIDRQLRDRVIDGVFFLARDGYLPKKFYDKILSQKKRPSSVYLYASRAAWHPATLNVVGYYGKWLFDAPEQLTARRVLKRMRLNGDPANRFQSLLTRSGIVLDDVLGRKGMTVMEALLGAPEGIELREAKAAEQRKLVTAYLEQMGFVAGQKHALVDLGWNGRLQHSLSLIRGCPVDLGLYAGLKASASAGTDIGPAAAFLFDERQSNQMLGSTGLMGNCIQILESFGLAPHPSVIGYQRNDAGKVEALFATEEGGAAGQGWSYARLGVVFDDYLVTAQLTEKDAECDPSRLRDACAGLLKAFVLGPSKVEAETWGAYPFVSDQAGGDPFELGRVLPPTSISHLLWALRGEVPYGPAAIWRVASRKRTPHLRRLLYFSAATPVKAWRRVCDLLAGRRAARGSG